MDYEMILKLIDKVSESSVTSLELEEDKLKIKIEKNVQIVGAQMPQVMPVTTAQVQMPDMAPQVIEKPVQPKAEPAVAEDVQMITSPIVGVFYAAPSPDAAPYVKVGDTVKKGQIVGIVEAMKLMNEIESEVDGVITEVLVNNQDGVEYGQPLFKVV